MLGRHREEDQRAIEPAFQAKETQRITRLQTDAAQIRQWLKANPEDRKGSKSAIRKSNRTDNESAKMATSKGVIQGYTGVAAVDARHQIIVEAQAHGTGSEQALLIPVVAAMNALPIKANIRCCPARFTTRVASPKRRRAISPATSTITRRRERVFAPQVKNSTATAVAARSTAM